MKIGVTGITGRMGKVIAETIMSNPAFELSAGLCRDKSNVEGQDIGLFLGRDKLGVNFTSDLDKFFAASEAIIDFSSIDLSLKCALQAAETGKILVCGTTGFDDEQKKRLALCARNAVIVSSANTSIGIGLLSNLSQKIAELLGEDYDVEIVEMHHRDKIDSPSGTALALGEAVARGRNLDFNEVCKKSRNGLTEKRSKKEIGISSIRGGDIIGEHKVIFAGNGETIELVHKASNRDIFAKGAIKAVIWASKRVNGFYSMSDVLDI
jgi:4-hydroxy-tetrahydrodipicolinate reductase